MILYSNNSFFKEILTVEFNFDLRAILGLGQRGRCCFCAACSNRKMYLEIRSANEGALSQTWTNY